MADGKLARTLYRSLLKASRNGRCPEVYGEHFETAALPFSSEGAASPPSTAREVRGLLRAAFASSPEMAAFSALRRANELSSILHPREEALRVVPLPVFDYGATSAMFGEELQLNFFEPRYLELARRATAAEGEGLFVLRARPELDDAEVSSPPVSLSVLMKIVEHTDPNADVVAVRCIAGPRLRVLQQEQSPSLMLLDAEKPRMIVATKLALNRDVDSVCSPNNDPDYLVKMRSRCLDILTAVTTKGSLFSFGLPPLDPEKFSFWSLRHVFDRSDTRIRHQWLSCRSTFERLSFVITLLEKFQQAKKENREQAKREMGNLKSE